MTSINQTQIEHIISNLHFFDQSSVKSRSSKIIIKGNKIGFSLDITGIEHTHAKIIAEKAKKQIEKLENIKEANIVLTQNTSAHNASEDKKSKIQVDGVRKIVMIASGKGGVGKSTITSLLAHKLAYEGKKVGIIDADIYGPSIPQIFSLKGKPELDNNRMIPLKNHGIVINSIGFLTDADSAVSFRGPMASKAIYQLMSLTKWNKYSDLDYLFIDTPPGTGDIHLSLIQNYLIDEVIMITTPQLISEIDVSRAINLYKKLGINIAGIIENMSYYKNPITGEKLEIFKGEAGAKISTKYQIKELGKIEINSNLSSDCDLGQSLAKHLKMIDKINI